MRHKVREAGLEARFSLDSCGTGAWHVGNPPDRRSVAVGARHGVDLSDLRARKVRREDFERFDLILAMDRSNFSDLSALQPVGSRAELGLYLDHCGLADRFGTREVPDPYYGDGDGFEKNYQMIAAASRTLIQNYGSIQKGR